MLVDDALLLAIITSHPDAEALASEAGPGEVFTTGSWYWRLARVVAHPAAGALSQRFNALADDERRQVRSVLSSLPSEIGLISLRNLVPVMAALGEGLNLLTAEALAAAVVLETEIAVTTSSHLLEDAARALGVSVRRVTLGGTSTS